MNRAASLLLLSLALHGAVVWMLLPPTPDAQTPRLALKTVSVRLLPSAATSPGFGAAPGLAQAVTLNQASTQTAMGEQRAGQPDDWLPSGRLTRLPAPLEPLDFGEELAAGFSGRVELVLLVDRGGKVRQVSTRDRDPGARAFAQALAPRIRNTLFSPGEVDGVAVNAIVKIAVVSERAAAQETSPPPSSI